MHVIARWIPLWLALVLGLAALWVILRGPESSRRATGQSADNAPQDDEGAIGREKVEASDGSAAAAGAMSPALSVLGRPPDWNRLNDWQNTISRRSFERLLTSVFVTGGRWREFIELDDEEARIRTGEGEEVFRLNFAAEGAERPASRRWKTAEDLGRAPDGKPLSGLHVAIDPGHIGGPWARMEERWLKVGDQPAIQEGDMTLWVARLLRPQLEALGAKVTWVRDAPEPVTRMRPDVLSELAAADAPPDSPEALQKLAERLFYRTAEIRARADLVNQKIRPDLVLCLHFNAEAWGDAAKPKLVDHTHFHILLNGAYTDDEVALSDQRFALLEKLLGGIHHEEVRVGGSVARVFAERTGLPPYLYPPDAPHARSIDGHPYLWARNLLANRLYECPVIFFEPYVMNSTVDHPRLVAGDYEGMREIGGRRVVSIFREYADAVAEGLKMHYGTRGVSD